MTLSDTEISDQLTQAISLMVSATFGEGFELASIPPVRLDRRYSFMFRYWLRRPDGKMGSLLVKIPHESWMSTMQQAMESEHLREVVKSEFDSMASIAKVIAESGNPNLCAIRPRAFFPKFNALLMEEIPIRMLKTSLQRLPIMLGTKKGWQDFRTHLQLAGEWLKVIHAGFASGQMATLESQAMNEKMELELESLEGLLTRPLKSLRSLFSLLYDSLKTTEVPLACIHNDYQLGNIFVMGEGSVGALDPNWVEGGSIYDDLATLIIDPVTRKAQVISQGLCFRSSLRRQYELAVLQGYFGASKYPYPILYFHCAFAALMKWRADEELLKTGDSILFSISSFFITPLIRVYFRRLIKDYLVRGLETTRT